MEVTNATNPVEAIDGIYSPTERYTAAEIARDHKLHVSTVRKLFAAEPGVLKIGRAVRIPGYVAARVLKRCTITAR